MNCISKEMSICNGKIVNTEFPFTSSLRLLHEKLALFDWKENIPECVFIRDYESLPNSASYDIDLLANENSWSAIVNVFQSLSNECSLIFLYRTSQAGLYLLIMDVTKEKDRRNWSYYEVHKKINVTNEKLITSDDIDIIYDKGLPIPSEPWQFLLRIHQGLRKGKITKYREYLLNLLKINKSFQSLCNEYLELSGSDISTILEQPENLDYWRLKTGVKYAVGKKEPVITKLSKIKKKLAKKIYLLHTKGPIFFTLHGADGVGKTTTLKEISEIISEYPFSHEVLHHITGWKYNNNHIKKNKNVFETNETVSVYRKIIRIVYRNLHPSIQGIWIHSSNYIKYSSNLNRYILDKFYNHKVIICDRYIYDLWAKYQVNSGYYKIHHPLHYMYCRAIRMPIKAFVINDKPEEIHNRKQELSIFQISQYQSAMDNIVKSLNVPVKHINVAGRKPREIACEIIKEILNNMGPDIFNLMKEEATKRAKLKY